MNKNQFPKKIDKDIFTIPKMKPCPFCARTDMDITQFQEEIFTISCKCGAETPSDSKSISAIVRKWNRRRYLAQRKKTLINKCAGEVEKAKGTNREVNDLLDSIAKAIKGLE